VAQSTPAPGVQAPASARRWQGALALVVAAFVVPFAYGAWRVFPVWDDASLWFSIAEHGPDGVRAWHADRPLSAAISATLARWGILWTVARPLHFAAWVGLGLMTARLWRRLFPELAEYAVLPAVLVIAPIFVQTQLILWNPILDAQLGSLMAFGAVLLCDAARKRTGVSGVAAWLGSGLLTVAGVLLSEYALVALIGLGSAMTFCVWSETRDHARSGAATHWRLWLRRLGALGVVAIVSYGVYARAAAASARLVVRPEYQLRAQGLRRILELPPRLGFALWEATVGNLAAAAGTIHLLRDSGPALACGAVGALLCYWLLRRTRTGPETPAGSPLRLGALAVALGVGLIPIIVMKVSPRAGSLSRLWLPVAPLAASLCAGAILHVVRPEFRRRLAVGIAAVAAFAIGQSVLASSRTYDEVTALGSKLRPHLAVDGLTVALFADYRFFTLGEDVVPDPEELTARLTAGWSDDERRHFWATVSSYVYAPRALPGLATVGSCALDEHDLAFQPDGKGLSRAGRIAKLLHVEQTAAGAFLIHDAPRAPDGAQR
jgi:hypothetical protein